MLSVILCYEGVTVELLGPKELTVLTKLILQLYPEILYPRVQILYQSG